MGHTPEGVGISPRGVAQGGRSQPPRISTHPGTTLQTFANSPRLCAPQIVPSAIPVTHFVIRMQVHIKMHRSSQLACRVFVNEVIAGCGCACSRPLALRDGSYAACKDTWPGAVS